MAARDGVKTFNLSFTIKMRPGPGTNKTMGVLAKYAKNRSLLIPILRAAMADSLLKAYEDRFLDSEFKMADLRRRQFGRNLGDKEGLTDSAWELKNEELIRKGTAPDATERELKKYLKAIGKRWGTEVQESGVRPGQVQEQEGGEIQYGKFETKGVADRQEAVAGTGASTVFELPRKYGEFTRLMAVVLNALVSESKIKTHRAGGVITLGIGSIKELDKIKTPQSTISNAIQPFGIMWRQLEFGTGIYAKRATSAYGGFRARGEGTKDPNKIGSWWLGERARIGRSHPNRGLHLLGTRSGNFLRQWTGIPYTTDGERFRGQFQALLTAALRGD